MISLLPRLEKSPFIRRWPVSINITSVRRAGFRIMGNEALHISSWGLSAQAIYCLSYTPVFHPFDDQIPKLPPRLYVNDAIESQFRIPEQHRVSQYEYSTNAESLPYATRYQPPDLTRRVIFSLCSKS